MPSHPHPSITSSVRLSPLALLRLSYHLPAFSDDDVPERLCRLSVIEWIIEHRAVYGIHAALQPHLLMQTGK